MTSATTGPTPGTVISRLAVSSCFASCRSVRTKIAICSSRPSRTAATEAIQQMLGDIAPQINIVTFDLATSMRRRQGRRKTPRRWRRATGPAPARTRMVWSRRSPQRQHLGEVQQFRAGPVDRCGACGVNPEKRLARYRQALAIVHEEVPGLRLFQMHGIYGARPRGCAGRRPRTRRSSSWTCAGTHSASPDPGGGQRESVAVIYGFW